ncbi:unnamed protein product, partial [Cuscuta europaea]
MPQNEVFPDDFGEGENKKGLVRRRPNCSDSGEDGGATIPAKMEVRRRREMEVRFQIYNSKIRVAASIDRGRCRSFESTICCLVDNLTSKPVAAAFLFFSYPFE